MAYTPPPWNAVDFDSGPAGYIPPAWNAVDFNAIELGVARMRSGGAYVVVGVSAPRVRSGGAYSVTAVGVQVQRSGGAYPVVGAPSQLMRGGGAYSVEKGAGDLLRSGGAYAVSVGTYQIMFSHASYSVQGISSSKQQSGGAYQTGVFGINLHKSGGAYDVFTYSVGTVYSGGAWEDALQVANKWRIRLAAVSAARSWHLPARLVGSMVARSWRLPVTDQRAARSWRLPVPHSGMVARSWHLPSQMQSIAARSWALPVEHDTLNRAARSWRLPSLMVENAITSAVEEDYVLVNGYKVAVGDGGLNIETSEGMFGWKCRFDVSSLSDYDLFKPELVFDAVMGGEAYTFVFDGKQRARNSAVEKRGSILGISPCAKYDEPRARLVTKTWQAVLVSDLLTELFPGEAIDFGILDWAIPALRLAAQNEAPRKIAQRVLTEGGALLECDRTGALLVRYRYPISVPDYATAVPDAVFTDMDHNITSDEGIQLGSMHNRLRIMDVATDSIQDRIDFIPNDGDNSRGILRVWPRPWRESFTLSHTSLPIFSVSKIGIQTEQLTETVEVIGSKGHVAKPIYTIDSYEYLYADLGGIVFDLDAEEFTTTSTALFETLIRITYTTRFVAYNAVAYTGAQVQFVVREPDNG